MTTIHDFSGNTSRPGGIPPIEAFLAARRNDRHQRAEHIAGRRREYRDRIEETKREHVELSEALFKRPNLGVIEREQLLRHHRTAMNTAVRTIKDECYLELGPKPLLRDLSPLRWAGERIDDARDRDDYLHVLKTSYDDRGFVDPVLIAIPGARRRRESGCSVYTARDGRQLLRVSHDTNEVMLHTKDEAALEAAIVKAHHDFGPPLVFASQDPNFISRCETIAEKYGFEVGHEVRATADRAAGPATAAETAAHAAGTPDTARATAPGGASPVEPAAPPSPVVDPNDDAYAELREAVTAEHGVRLFMALTPEAKMRLSGPLLNFVPHPTVADYRVAAIGVGDGATLVAVRNLAVAAIEPGETMILRGVGAEWETEVVRTQAEAAPDVTATHDDDRPLVNSGGRGR
jgi:hypothetical protein